MAKSTILKERGTGEELYPQTLASLVLTSEGKNAEEAIDTAKRSLFIDQWNVVCGNYGRYNEATGFFELNGLTDITYEEALKIYSLTGNLNINGSFSLNSLPIRTNMPLRMSYNGESNFTAGTDFHNNIIEVVNLASPYGDAMGYLNLITHGFRFPKVRKIIGTVIISNVQQYLQENMMELPQCEEVFIRFNKENYTGNIPLGYCGKLNLASMQFLVSNIPLQQNDITITVHPDVYAKLTDQTNTEWHAVLLAALDKNITFATV